MSSRRLARAPARTQARDIIHPSSASRRVSISPIPSGWMRTAAEQQQIQLEDRSATAWLAVERAISESGGAGRFDLDHAWDARSSVAILGAVITSRLVRSTNPRCQQQPRQGLFSDDVT
jgi:hypothetical protein